jgi:hypothetical protein
MIQQFKNMNELVEYLGRLEDRLKTLEEENGKLRAVPPAQENIDGNVVARYVATSLPQTNLLSRGFLKRAFAVWGHFFVANLLIGITVGIIYLCIGMVLFGSVFGNLIQNPR